MTVMGTTSHLLPENVRVTQVNIPEGDVALKKGTNVLANNGDHIGDIDEVLIDPNSHQISHFVLSPGL